MAVPGRAHITVSGPSLVYVVVDDRATFDALPVPALDRGGVLVKTGRWGEATLVFQFWLTTPPALPKSPNSPFTIP